MRMKKMKLAAVAALMGTCSGCLSGLFDSWWGTILYDGLLDVAWEYVWDNNDVTDFFTDN